MKLDDAVKALAALAQNSRLEVFRLLVRSGKEGLPAGQIAEELEITPATLSFHLKELAHAGLINQRREGRSLIYTLNIETMRLLLGYLVHDCCQGRPELCQPDELGSGCCGEVQPSRKRRTRRTLAK